MYSFHERMGKEPTVISLKLSKNTIENFSHTPNLQLSGGNFEGEIFSNSKIVVTGHQGNQSLVLSALWAYTKEVCRFALICKIWKGNGELATWGSKTTSGSATWTASTPALSSHLSCSLGMPWIRKTSFANWRQPNDPTWKAEEIELGTHLDLSCRIATRRCAWSWHITSC